MRPCRRAKSSASIIGNRVLANLQSISLWLDEYQQAHSIEDALDGVHHLIVVALREVDERCQFLPGRARGSCHRINNASHYWRGIPAASRCRGILSWFGRDQQ